MQGNSNFCRSMSLVDGEFVKCEGHIVEKVERINGEDVLIERCLVCGKSNTLAPVVLGQNIRQRFLSDDILTPLQYLL